MSSNIKISKWTATTKLWNSFENVRRYYTCLYEFAVMILILFTWVYWRPEYIGDLVLSAILCGRSTLWWDSFNIKYSLQGKQFYPSSLTDISTMFPVSPYTSHYTSHITHYTLCSVHMLSGSSSGCRGVVSDGLVRPTSVYTASIRGLLSNSKSLS